MSTSLECLSGESSAAPLTRPLVLVAEPLARAGLATLSERAELVVQPSPEEFGRTLARCHGLIVRSETQVDRALLERAPRLRAVARAGAGVDNVDVAACTERGVAVLNAPGGNAVAVGEHVIGQMLVLARHFREADAALKRGEWGRTRFTGFELLGRTLGIVGIGRVGSEVARRARCLGMKVLAHDPYVAPGRAAELGVELVGLEQVLLRSQFVTLHVPSTPETRGMIGEPQLAMMPAGSYLINCSRGSVVQVEPLIAALDSGHLAAAAIDVFPREPAAGHPLALHPKVLATPHVAGSTYEALDAIATDVAQRLLAVLEGEPPLGAVNGFDLDEVSNRDAPLLRAAERAGALAVQLAAGAQLRAVEVGVRGQAAERAGAPYVAAALAGLLGRVAADPVNWINARALAARHGLVPSERRSPDAGPHQSLVQVTITADSGSVEVSVTADRGEPRVVSLLGYPVDLPLQPGHWLATRHSDRPGMVGRVGTLLGEAGVNISAMHVGRLQPRGDAVMLLAVDDPIPDALIATLRADPAVRAAWHIEL